MSAHDVPPTTTPTSTVTPVPTDWRALGPALLLIIPVGLTCLAELGSGGLTALGAVRLLVLVGATVTVTGPLLEPPSAGRREMGRADLALGVIGGLVAGGAAATVTHLAPVGPLVWWSTDLVIAVAVVVIAALHLDRRQRGVAGTAAMATIAALAVAHSTEAILLWPGLR